MMPRIIPTLLLKGCGLLKGINFKNHRYIGDPINAVRIFNAKEVDELILLDITASFDNRLPNVDLIQQIADECYMPFGVGGGIFSIEQMRKIFKNGAEKVIINTSAVKNPDLIKQAADIFGSQSITVSMDVRKNWLNKERVYINSGRTKTSLHPVEWAKKIEMLGAGEILLTSITHEGNMDGYNLNLIKRVSKVVNIPVIASGGAGRRQDFPNAIMNGASACSAGSMFVFKGKLRGILINYPNKSEIVKVFKKT